MPARSSVTLPHRSGISFRIIGKHLRSIYHQFNGEIELADVCTCKLVEAPPRRCPGPCACCGVVSFVVVRSLDCPIDEHRAAAIRESAA